MGRKMGMGEDGEEEEEGKMERGGKEKGRKVQKVEMGEVNIDEERGMNRGRAGGLEQGRKWGWGTG